MRDGRRRPRARRAWRRWLDPAPATSSSQLGRSALLLLALLAPLVYAPASEGAVAFQRPTRPATPFSYGLPAHQSVPRWALHRGRGVHFYPAMPPAAALATPASPGAGSGAAALATPASPGAGSGAAAPSGAPSALSAAANGTAGPEQAPTAPGPAHEGELGRRCGGCLGVPLRYFGGPVQHAPEVHVIFWGRNWNAPSGPGPQLREEVMAFYAGLSNSASGSEFQGILTQYFDESGRVPPTLEAHKLTSFTDETTAAPTAVGDAGVEHEARVAAADPANGWALAPDAQFVVIPAPGSTYESGFGRGFCAYHSVVRQPGSFWTYTFLSYDGEAPFESGCLSYDHDQAAGHREKAGHVLSMDAAHEYSESATDPSFGAWLDAEGNEIADICSSGDDELANGSWVQGLWDDHQSACSLSDGEPPHVLGLTEGPSGVGEHDATLNATVNAENEGRQTSYRFEYGPTTSYGQSAPAAGPLDLGGAFGNQQVHQTVSGLQPEATYHYRVVASNDRGESTFGEDHTFVPSLWSTGEIRPAPGAGQASFGSALLSCSFLPWSCGGTSCPSTTSCVAVGSYELNGREVPMADTWDAGRWSFQALPFPPQTGTQVALTGISCAAAGQCLAVGYERNATGLRVPVSDRMTGGGEWSVSPIALPAGAKEAGLEGVSCASPSECMAVGLSVSGSGAPLPYAARWRNGSWSAAQADSPGGSQAILEGVSCASNSSCVAVGFREAASGAKSALTERWTAAGWSITSPKPPPQGGSFTLSGVSCSSAEMCIAVGSETVGGRELSLAERWDGTEWSLQPTAGTGSQEELLGVSCPSSRECTAVGEYERGGHWVAMVQRWDGAAWSTQASNVDQAQASELHAVSCATAATCAAVGITGWSAAGRSRSGFVEALGEIRTTLAFAREGTAPGLGPAAIPAQALAGGPQSGYSASAPARHAAAVRCRVPRLLNASLRRARGRLSRAHCALGRVRRPRHWIGDLVIRGQSHASGASLAANAKVNVTLGNRPRAHPRRR